MALVLTTFAALVFYGYAAAIIILGVYDSISNSWYYLKERGEFVNKNYIQTYFTTWCGLMATSIIYPLLVITSGMWCFWLAPLMSLGFLVVGASPDYTSTKFTIWHYVGAGLICLPAIIISMCLGYALIVWGILAVCYIIQHLTKKRDYILCAEMGAGTIMFLVMYLQLLK